jgi:hypothetical protein
MARDGYEVCTVVWDGRSVEVSYQANWLNSGQWHIELRCGDPLPVTTTGYRSAFISTDIIEDAVEIEGYILAWLDHAAEDPAWERSVEESRQLKLF